MELGNEQGWMDLMGQVMSCQEELTNHAGGSEPLSVTNYTLISKHKDITYNSSGYSICL